MFVVAAFYHFTRFDDPGALRPPLLALAEQADVKGTILLAQEGVNGTVAGPAAGIEAVIAHLRALPGCAGLEWKRSEAAEPPFLRLKVRLKAEIVTLGEPGVDPTRRVGAYVAPADWNALISRDDVAVIDARNGYEVSIGGFAGAIDPETESFRDFPAWWRANKAQFAGKKVAMYCTGGIRCEKASAFLLEEGAPEVFHLKGGILKYLEEIPAEASLWRGECFVFDGRVSVGHGLAEGDYTLCHACRRPLSVEARADPAYRAGVSCPHCAEERTAADRARFAERQKQIALAKARGERHLGG